MVLNELNYKNVQITEAFIKYAPVFASLIARTGEKIFFVLLVANIRICNNHGCCFIVRIRMQVCGVQLQFTMYPTRSERCSRSASVFDKLLPSAYDRYDGCVVIREAVKDSGNSLNRQRFVGTTRSGLCLYEH